MKMMGVDLGLARTGISQCDVMGMLASPNRVIHQKNEEKLIEEILQCVSEIKPERIVVGLPLNMDGSKGERATECERIGKIIEEKSEIPVVMWDERCTTVMSHQALNVTNTRGKKRKAVGDAVAAVMILQSYIDSI